MNYPEHSRRAIQHTSDYLRASAAKSRRMAEELDGEDAAVQWETAQILDHMAGKLDPQVDHRSAG
jgi:hypothetical protein